jgi:hypothetical protein
LRPFSAIAAAGARFAWSGVRSHASPAREKLRAVFERCSSTRPPSLEQEGEFERLSKEIHMPKTTRRRAAPLPSVAAAPAACPASDASTDEAHPQRHVTVYGTARDLRHDGSRTGTQWSPVLRLSGRWL